MLALRLPPEIEARLDALAKRTGRTKSYYARQAILEHIEDLEDAYLADERIRTDTGERISLEDVMAEFANDLKANPAGNQRRAKRGNKPR
jgi:RHH-type transcriptional regulator, rel operon repressor / antitoxin RelB